MALSWPDRVASDASLPSLQLVFQSLRAPIVDAPAVSHLSHCLPLTNMRRRSAVKVSGPAVAAALMIQHAFELAHDRVSCRDMIENYAANGGMLRAKASCIAPYIASSHLSRILFSHIPCSCRSWFLACLAYHLAVWDQPWRASVHRHRTLTGNAVMLGGRFSSCHVPEAVTIGTRRTSFGRPAR